MIDYIASLTSYLILVGSLLQVWKNYKTGKSDDLSEILVLSFIYESISWALYGGKLKNLFIFGPNFAGLLLNLVILWQIYNKKINAKRIFVFFTSGIFLLAIYYTPTFVVGVNANISSFLIFGGTFWQIWLNFRTRKVEGISTFLVLTYLTENLVWTLYGFKLDDLLVILPYFAGVVTSTVFLYQVIRYRKTWRALCALFFVFF